MNTSVVLIFSLIMASSILTLSIIVKFLRNKEIVKRNVQDQIQVDLALLTLFYVTSSSTMIIARETIGPFDNIIALKTILLISQWVFNSCFSCVISLQLRGHSNNT